MGTNHPTPYAPAPPPPPPCDFVLLILVTSVQGLKAEVNSTSSASPKVKCRFIPDETLSILYYPRGQELKKEPKVCGVDEGVDPERLISEWNGPYIFQLMDHSKETNMRYKTQVFQVPSPTPPSGSGSPSRTAKSSGNTTTTKNTTITTKTTTEMNKTDEALYLLFIAPPGTSCTASSLEKAGNGDDGFY